MEHCGITSVSVQTSFSIKVSGLKLDAILLDRFASPPPEVRAITPDARAAAAFRTSERYRTILDQMEDGCCVDAGR